MTLAVLLFIQGRTEIQCTNENSKSRSIMKSMFSVCTLSAVGHNNCLAPPCAYRIYLMTAIISFGGHFMSALTFLNILKAESWLKGLDFWLIFRRRSVRTSARIPPILTEIFLVLVSPSRCVPG
jgi:hypothetical protein